MLTCACGARFEVDDSLAGQEVLCPECQQPMQAPALDRVPRLTSGWALASVILALIGAFTLVGSFMAAVLGVCALGHIARNRQRVAGTGFAVLGICLGLFFTGLSGFALWSSDLFGLDGLVRENTLTQRLDTSGPLEIVRAVKGFAITRPSEKWGQVPNNQSDDPAVSGLQKSCDLLLMQAARYAFIDVRAQPRGRRTTLDQCQTEVLAELNSRRQASNPFEDDGDVQLPTSAQLQSSRRLDGNNGIEGREMEVDVRCIGQSWRFVIRLYRKGNGPIYVVRAYVPKRRFAPMRSELEQALDSFRILSR